MVQRSRTARIEPMVALSLPTSRTQEYAVITSENEIAQDSGVSDGSIGCGGTVVVIANDLTSTERRRPLFLFYNLSYRSRIVDAPEEIRKNMERG